MSARYTPPFQKPRTVDTRTWAQVPALARDEHRVNPDEWLNQMTDWCASDDAEGFYMYLGGGEYRIHFFFSDHETAFRFKIRWG